MTTENFVYKNIYLFGECYFSNDLSIFLNQNFANITVTNLSVSGGSSDNFLTILKMYHRELEPGLFLVGGSIHDQWRWRNGDVIKDIIKWFDTSFAESILVFCQTGPMLNIEDRKYNHNEYNTFKKSMTNNRNIFSLDVRHTEEAATSDKIHLNNLGKSNLNKKILEFLLGFFKNFNKKPIEILSVNKTVNELEINEPVPLLSVIHGHNSDLFTVYVNGQIQKQFGFYMIPEEKRVGYIPYLDRMIVSTYNNVPVGKITFSEPIYVKAMIK
jgi:hypothetical protein